MNSFRPRVSAFSLVEVVLALGVIAFALVGIMGLFFVAMRSAADSHRETRATFIAQQIFNDMQSTPGTNTFIATNTNLLSPQLGLSLETDSTTYVGYNAEGRPVEVIGASAFQNGVNGGDAVFFAQIQVTANTPVNGLSRVQAIIETPAAAAAAARSSYSFVTLLDQQ